jgi:hypothetical protein
MGKFVDGLVKFVFGYDKNDGSYRQDKYEKDQSGGHEHSWSKTGDGRHKEGWHGSKHGTRSNRSR